MSKLDEPAEIVAEPPETSCVACKSAVRFYGRREQFAYHRCPVCETIQLYPLPTREELERAYAETYAAAGHISPEPARSIEETRTHQEAILRALMDHRIGDDVAEIGAGWGGLAKLLVENGFRYEGVEPSAAMAAYCQSIGLPVHRGELDTLQRDSYSAIAMCNVFEHLVDHDTWLGKATRLLRPGGILVSGQPTARFLHLAASVLRLGDTSRQLPQLHQSFCPPWHVVFFSLSGMEKLLSRHGLGLVEVRPMPQGRSGGIAGWFQRSLEATNRLGWSLFGTSWPLVIGHIFVFKKGEEPK